MVCLLVTLMGVEMQNILKLKGLCLLTITTLSIKKHTVYMCG